MLAYSLRPYCLQQKLVESALMISGWSRLVNYGKVEEGLEGGSIRCTVQIDDILLFQKDPIFNFVIITSHPCCRRCGILKLVTHSISKSSDNIQLCD